MYINFFFKKIFFIAGTCISVSWLYFILNFYFFIDVFTSNFIAVMDYTHQRILQIDLKTGAVVKLPLSISRSTGLAFDKSTKTLFFSSINQTIMSTSLHGKKTMFFFTIGIRFVIDFPLNRFNIYM